MSAIGKRAFWQLQVASLGDDLYEALKSVEEAAARLAEVKVRSRRWESGKPIWGRELKPAQKRLRDANEHVATVRAALAYAKGMAK